MIRQILFVPLRDTNSAEDRTRVIEATCNLDWLAEYRLVGTSLFSTRDAPALQPNDEIGYYLFFEKD